MPSCYVGKEADFFTFKVPQDKRQCNCSGVTNLDGPFSRQRVFPGLITYVE